jgi:hypothetical protein
MNLHAIVRGPIRSVNPDVVATVRVSLGADTLPSGKQVPTFVDQPGIVVQVQALAAKEIEHLDSLNIQGDLRGFWISGDVKGLNRPAGRGGDLIIFDGAAPESLAGSTWLVVQVLETWDASGWCHVAGARQL